MQVDFSELQRELDKGKLNDEIPQLLPFETATPIIKLKFIAFIMDESLFFPNSLN